jgi:hypothetical protein
VKLKKDSSLYARNDTKKRLVIPNEVSALAELSHYQIFRWLDRDVPRRGIFAAPGDLR